jgi:hypothetical protein
LVQRAASLESLNAEPGDAVEFLQQRVFIAKPLALG